MIGEEKTAVVQTFEHAVDQIEFDLTVESSTINLSTILNVQSQNNNSQDLTVFPLNLNIVNFNINFQVCKN